MGKEIKGLSLCFFCGKLSRLYSFSPGKLDTMAGGCVGLKKESTHTYCTLRIPYGMVAKKSSNF